SAPCMHEEPDMFRMRTYNTMLVSWGFRIAVLGAATLIVIAPVDGRGAPKIASKKGPATTSPAGKDSSDKEAATEAAGGAKGTDDKAPAVSIKLPEVYSTGYNGSYIELINFINTQIRQGWIDNGLRPAEVADDAEWVRRVHLDIVGHIPDLEAVQKFVADKDKAKRSKLIDKLVDEDPGYVRHLTTIWTNNLIGRAPPPNNRGGNRGPLQKFARDSQRKTAGGKETDSDLRREKEQTGKSGPATYLLPPLNEGAVPATAISARLFLGMQVQCTQCHNHPFNEWKQ